MEKYDDELLPESFEQIAKAYSKTLKDKGFVFVRLEEEEFNLLLCEIFVLISKMQACLKKLSRSMDSHVLAEKLRTAKAMLQDKFGQKATHKFVCVEDESGAFLSLVAIENTLIIKLMLLSVKSGELEVCNHAITAISSVFAESFSCEGFRVKNE